MNSKYAFDAHLDLHQTEFDWAPRNNAMVLLPFLQPELPEPLRQTNQRWGEAIIRAWQAAGAAPIAEAKPSPVRNEDLRHDWQKCWGEIVRTRPFMLVEVQNNNVRTPPRTQMELTDVAIRTTIDFLLASGDPRAWK
jgi:hypothetical protein